MVFFSCRIPYFSRLNRKYKEQMSNYHQDHDKLQDVQNRADKRGVLINNVGISDIRYPIEVQMEDGKWQNTIGSFRISVKLPAEKKGTHMSRMVEVLNTYRRYGMQEAKEIMEFVSTRLDAVEAYIDIEFPFFVEKAAPETAKISLMEYTGKYHLSYENGVTDFKTGVVVNVTSLCPCSKEISDYGAHNQRSEVQITVHPSSNKRVGLLSLVTIAEESASAPLYPLLKREDERHVTMLAFDNPVFVEDLSRNVALKLHDMSSVLDKAFIKVINFESIHKHNAFAEIALTF